MADNGKRKGITLLKVIIGLNYFSTAISVLSFLITFKIGGLVGGAVSATLAYNLSIGSTRALKASIFFCGFGFIGTIATAVMISSTAPIVSIICSVLALIGGYLTYQQIQSTSLREELAERALHHQQKATEEQDTLEALEKEEFERKAAEEAAALERQNQVHIKK